MKKSSYALALSVVIFLIVPIYSMHTLSTTDAKEIKNRIQQIEFARQQGAAYFMGSGQSMQGFINSQIKYIEKVLDKNSIDYPQEKTWKWLAELKENISNEKKEKFSEECDISGLDKAAVLEVLYKAAQPGQFYPSKTQNYSKDFFEKTLKDHDYNIDYLDGKPLKISLTGDTLNTFLYNRDNGSQAAQEAIKVLRRDND